MLNRILQNQLIATACVGALGLLMGGPTFAGSGSAADTPPAHESIAQIKASCREAAEEIKRRQAESSLYERLGGRERIGEVTDEIVRLHRQNEQIRTMFRGVDTDRLTTQVADWMASQYSGDAEYKGRDMISTHAHLGVTDAHFLTAGGDIKKALGNLGYGEQVTQEVICSLIPFHEQVVTK